MPEPAAPPLGPRERALVILLRLGGVIMLSALVAVFLPRSAMDAIHRSMELGPLPPGPLVDYLARSASLLYAVHGALLLLISTDVRRHRSFVLFIAWSDVVLGIALGVIDLEVGMPLWWTLAEGPWVTAVGLLMIWLARGLQPAHG